APRPPSPLPRGANKTRRKSHYPWTKDGGQVTSKTPRIRHRLVSNWGILSVMKMFQQEPVKKGLVLTGRYPGASPSRFENQRLVCCRFISWFRHRWDARHV